MPSRWMTKNRGKLSLVPAAKHGLHSRNVQQSEDTEIREGLAHVSHVGLQGQEFTCECHAMTQQMSFGRL
jgi:hypothetical protein